MKLTRKDLRFGVSHSKLTGRNRKLVKFRERLKLGEFLMPIARMRSKGPWYDPAVRANSILGRRAGRKGQMPWSSVIAQIETQLKGKLATTGRKRGPTRQTVRAWERKDPGYPEKALETGVIGRSDLLPWAPKYLGSKAKMGQAPRPKQISRHGRVASGGARFWRVRPKPGCVVRYRC